MKPCTALKHGPYRVYKSYQPPTYTEDQPSTLEQIQLTNIKDRARTAPSWASCIRDTRECCFGICYFRPRRDLPFRSFFSHQSYLWMLPRCSSWQVHAVLPFTSVAVVDDLHAKCPRTMVLELILRTVRGRLGDLVSDASYPPLYSGSSSAPRCHLTCRTIPCAPVRGVLADFLFR